MISVKRVNRFRYRKVTPQLLSFMKLLRSYRLTFAQIAEVCGLTDSTVYYHLTPKEHARAIARAKHRSLRPDVQEYYAKRRKLPKTRKRMREYMRERYRKDPEFRHLVIRLNKESRERRKMFA